MVVVLVALSFVAPALLDYFHLSRRSPQEFVAARPGRSSRGWPRATRWCASAGPGGA